MKTCWRLASPDSRAEVMDHDLAKVIRLVAGNLVKTVVGQDIVGRVMLQNAIKPGLSEVWALLLGFADSEFHMKTWKQLTGHPFGQVFVSFEDAIPIGIKSGLTGDVLINPTDEYYLQEGDEVIVLAEDEDTYAPGKPFLSTIPDGPRELKGSRAPCRILFMGWRRRMDDLIHALDTLSSEGTELWLYNEMTLAQRAGLLEDSGLDPLPDLKNIKLVYKEDQLVGDMIDRKKLEALRPETFTSILILAGYNSRGTSIADADSQTLAALLLIRDIQRSRLGKFPGACTGVSWYECMAAAAGKTAVVCEILDSRTQQLLDGWDICEFVLSNELVSMVLAMESENSDVSHVLEELFDANGSMMSVSPATKYIREGEELCFFDLMQRGRSRKEIVIGYKPRGSRYPILNPKDKRDVGLTLGTVDSVLLVSEFWAAKENVLAPFVKSEYVDVQHLSLGKSSG